MAYNDCVKIYTLFWLKTYLYSTYPNPLPSDALGQKSFFFQCKVLKDKILIKRFLLGNNSYARDAQDKKNSKTKSTPPANKNYNK